MGAVIAAIVRGLAAAVLAWFAAFRQGVRTQQALDLQATLDKEHAVDDAVDAVKNEPVRDFYLGADGRVHRVHGQLPPPAVHRGSDADPQ